MFFQSWKVGGFNDTGDGLWFVSEHKIKQGLAGGGMRVMVVDELSHGDVFSPCFRVGATEDVEVGFDLLIEPFHFSIGLRVACCG